MRSTIASLVSLFVSCFILMLGNGLINILLPVRMQLELMSTDTIGMVLSLYFVGMLIGSVLSKNLIKRSGHIRMFAGSIALAAVSVLVCSLYTDPILWGAMRILIGFCNACAYTAMESWLNGASNKDTRGKVLAFYNAVVLGGTFGGQFLINVASPAETVLFVISGIILCLAVVPMAWSRHRGPEVTEADSMSVLALLKRSPLGVVACFTSGIIYAAVFNLIPLFGAHYGMEGFELSVYVGSATLGAFLLQFPVGYLSDRFDRRSVLLIALLISTAVGFSVQMLAEMQVFWALCVATAITSGIIACTYPLSISEAFDKLKQSEMVAAMGSLILAFSVGGVLGPYTISLLMDLFGSQNLYYLVGIVQLVLAGFVVIRMKSSTALPAEEQENFVMQSAAAPIPVELDPRTEYVEAVMPLSPEAKTAVEIAEQDPATAVRMAKTLVVAKPEQGVEIAAEVAKVDGVDPLRLYEVMLETVPDQILEVTSAMVKATPDLAYELVRKLAETAPDDVVAIAAEIGRTLPELRIDMAKVAVESAPESAVEVAEYYAQVMSEEREAIRPADREDDTSEQDAADLVSQLSELAPEHTIEMATTIVEAVPDSAVNVASEVASNLPERAAEEQEKDNEQELKATTEPDQPTQSAEGKQAADQQDVQTVADNTEVVAESAQVVEGGAQAVESAEQIAESNEAEASESSEEAWHQEAAELVTRLAEVAPEHAMDIGVAVVEAQPEAAVAVATEYANTIPDRQSEDAEAEAEVETVSTRRSEGYTEVIGEPDHSDDEQEEDTVANEAAALVSRLAEAAPDQAMDIGVAVVEALPETAAAVAAEYASTISDRQADSEDQQDETGLEETTSVSAQTDLETSALISAKRAEESGLDVTTESGADDKAETEITQEAVELVSRLTEAAPEQAIDIGVAVVETLPETAVAVATEYASTIPDRQSEDAEAEAEFSAQQDSLEDPVLSETADKAQEGVSATEEDSTRPESESAEVDSFEIDSLEVDGLEVNSGNTELDSVSIEAAELVSRLAEAVPDQAMDIGVAVVETLPETAVAVATEYANTLSDRHSEDEGEESSSDDGVEATKATADASEDIDSAENSDAESDITQEAVELVNRLAEAVPDQAVDIGAAVVEAVPESASDVVEALAGSDQVQDSDLVSDLSDRPDQGDKSDLRETDQASDHSNASQSDGEK